ncbi:MAG: regulatory protein RecX [Bacteroidales bacterium]
MSQESEKQLPIPEWILQKAQSYCAYQERSIREVRRHLQKFQIQDEMVDKVIGQLLEDDFLNEERLAVTYASGKLRINHWGRNKIYKGLQQKGVPELFIQHGINSLDEDEYRRILRDILRRKLLSLNDADPRRKYQKLVTFATGRGFEVSLASEVARNLIGAVS